MNTNELPKTYKGYSTADLLDILHKISGGLREDLGIPLDKMAALGALTREYRLTPESRAAAGMMQFNFKTQTAVN